MFDMHHACLAVALRYFSMSIVIIAVHIRISTALGLVPRKDSVFRSCLTSLKNTSISQRALYSSAMVTAVQEKLLVTSSMTLRFFPSYTATLRSFLGYFCRVRFSESMMYSSLSVC